MNLPKVLARTADMADSRGFVTVRQGGFAVRRLDGIPQWLRPGPTCCSDFPHYLSTVSSVRW